jgi:preprotein translocase subunit YajC
MRETRGDSTVELHIGAKVSLAGGKITGTVLAHRGRIVTIRTPNGAKMRIEKRLIETIMEAFV